MNFIKLDNSMYIAQHVLTSAFWKHKVLKVSNKNNVQIETYTLSILAPHVGHTPYPTPVFVSPIAKCYFLKSGTSKMAECCDKMVPAPGRVKLMEGGLYNVAL